jgi:hypothetical protein
MAKKDVGEFKDGLLNGFATRYSAKGDILKQGIWKDDEFQRAQEAPPVPVVETPIQDDEIVSASSGSGFVSDLPPCPSSGYFHNCFGTWSDGKGYKYVGEWRDDKQNGQGTATWADGDVYTGDWKNGAKHGQGKFIIKIGGSYVGGYRNDSMHGQGTFTYSMGDVYVGE